MKRYVIFAVCVSFFCSADGGYLKRKHAQRLLRAPDAETSDLPPDQWLTQKLDHFDPTNPSTWWQRYQVNEKWVKNSSNTPVFLMIGGESAIDATWMASGAWMDYANTYGALCFQLEHRFYGGSQPTGDLSVRSLRYLTSEQALADVAYFINAMNQKYKLTPNNKWIVIGGSYSGSLAAWARLKYPHLIHAAISTSGPVLAQADFKKYNIVVKQSLTASSPLCASNVHLAALQVYDGLSKPNVAKEYKEKFNLCSGLDLTSPGDVSNFIESLATNFQGVVQYNKDNILAPNFVKPPTVDDLCAIMTNTSVKSLVDRYAEVNKLINGAQCLDISYHDSIQEVQDSQAPNDVRSWTYQTCAEFGFYQTSSSRQELFGPGFDLQFFIDQCKVIFDNDFDRNRLNDGVERSNILYGQLNIVDHVTNVIFVQGSLDPWHVLGVYKSTNPKAPAILIKGTAHCANMYTPSPDDPPQLVAARKKIVQFLGQVLSTGEFLS